MSRRGFLSSEPDDRTGHPLVSNESSKFQKLVRTPVGRSRCFCLLDRFQSFHAKLVLALLFVVHVVWRVTKRCRHAFLSLWKKVFTGMNRVFLQKMFPTSCFPKHRFQQFVFLLTFHQVRSASNGFGALEGNLCALTNHQKWGPKTSLSAGFRPPLRCKCCKANKCN